MAAGKRAVTKVETRSDVRSEGRASRGHKRVGAGLLVVVLVAAAGFFFLWRGPARLARVAPDNVALFVEFPDLARAVEAASEMKVFDAGKIAPKEAEAFVVDALRGAFGVDGEEATRLAESVVGVAFASRPTPPEDRGVWMVSVASRVPIERWLESSRFTPDGTYRGGISYRLAAKDPGPNANLLERALSSLAERGPPERVVWFSGARLLLIGEQTLISDVAEVLDGRRKPLEANALYAASRKAAPSDASGFFFGDEGALSKATLRPGTRSLVDSYLSGGGGASGSVRFAAAGTVLSLDVAISGKALPADGKLPGAAPLTIPARLPAETAFYVSASTKHTAAPADVRAALLALVPSSSAAQVAADVDAVERDLGITVSDLAEVAGDELTVALLADKAFKYGGSIPLLQAGLDWAGAAIVVKVENDAAAQRLLAKLRAAADGSDLGKLATLTPSPDGFELAMSAKAAALIGGMPPGVRVRYAKKELVIVLARPELMRRTFAALDGAGASLKDDASHTLAMGALRPGARAYAWLDMGRVASTAFAAGPSARVHAKGRGMPVDALVLEGPSRVAVAAALNLESRADGWVAHADVLNPWAAGLLIAWQPVAEPPRPAPTPTPAPSASPDAGAAPRPFFPEALDEMATCGDYLRQLDVCAERARSPEARDGFKKRRADALDKFVHTPSDARMVTNATCVGPMVMLQKNPDCR